MYFYGDLSYLKMLANMVLFIVCKMLFLKSQLQITKVSGQVDHHDQ